MPRYWLNTYILTAACSWSISVAGSAPTSPVEQTDPIPEAPSTSAAPIVAGATSGAVGRSLTSQWSIEA